MLRHINKKLYRIIDILLGPYLQIYTQGYMTDIHMNYDYDRRTYTFIAMDIVSHNVITDSKTSSEP